MSAEQDIREGLDEIRRSAFVSGNTRKSYVKASPAESQRVFVYLDGGVVPDPFPTTLMGSGLTKVERGKRALAPEPPPPDPANAYFDATYTDGLIKSPWTLAFSYAGDGTHDLPLAQTPDGRVAVVPDPAGGPEKCWRSEVRNSDPGWPPLPGSQKAQVRTTTSYMFNKPQREREWPGGAPFP